jgi:hypothetical protein
MMLKSQYEKNKSISELTPTEKDTLDIVDALTYCGDNDTIWPGLCYKAANEIISLEIEVGLLRSIKRAYDPVSQGKNI